MKTIQEPKAVKRFFAFFKVRGARADFFRHMMSLKEVGMMRENSQNQTCIAVIGSMTQAMQAQHALRAAAIGANVMKADSSLTKRGCAYAVSYPCTQEKNVRSVFLQNGIRVLSFEKGGRHDLFG